MKEGCSKCLVSTIILTLVIFAYDFVVHGVLLANLYEATANLWREKKEFELSCLLTMLGYYFVFSAVIVKLYKRFVIPLPGDRRKNCVDAGILVGILLALTTSGFYFYMPIPLTLAVAWFASALFLGILSGYVLYFRNRE